MLFWTNRILSSLLKTLSLSLERQTHTLRKWRPNITCSKPNSSSLKPRRGLRKLNTAAPRSKFCQKPKGPLNQWFKSHNSTPDQPIEMLWSSTSCSPRFTRLSNKRRPKKSRRIGLLWLPSNRVACLRVTSQTWPKTLPSFRRSWTISSPKLRNWREKLKKRTKPSTTLSSPRTKWSSR